MTALSRFVLLLPLALSTAGVAQDGPRPPGERELVASLAAQGIRLDPRAGTASVLATVEVDNDLLEYLLVGPGGARHETLLATDVRPSLLNVALLGLGVEPGRNATWTERDPAPSEAEREAGVAPYEVHPPEGDGFWLYAGWRRGDEVFFVRIEDLVRNLATGQTMRRHRWVYLGSRMLPAQGGESELFAADVYQNLINVSWFSDGATLLTGALPECLEQTIWMSNAWLLPQRGSALRLVFARERLDAPPPDLLEVLPDLGPAPSPYEAPGEGR
ncbi:MAG TPA: YdjY domain-containing protein [Planctomycetota bacterium]|nr:YdjY domain-containing protein [Planctomycetota bacterium]